MTAKRRREAIFVLAAGLLSLQAVSYRLVACDPPLPVSQNSPEMLVAGVAATPYQYRALLPWIVRGAIELRLIDPSRQLLLFVILETLAWFVLAFAFRRFLQLFVGNAALAASAALSVYAVMPFNYFEQIYVPYDVPSVLLFTIALTALYERRWILYFVVFAAATLNRETSLFLTLVCVFVLRGQYPPGKVIALTSLQAGLWLAIKLALFVAYADNLRAGYGLFDLQLMVNAATLVEAPGKIVVAMATWGGIWLAVLAWYRRIRDEFLSRALWSVPVMMAAMLVVGFVLELRIYGEALPILLAAFWVGLFDTAFEYYRRHAVA